MVIILNNIVNKDPRDHIDFDDVAGFISASRHTVSYLARYSHDKEIMPVVVKVPKSNLKSDIERLKRQSEILLDSELLPQIVTFLTLTNKDKTQSCALVTEYKSGIPLSHFIVNELTPKFENPYPIVRNLYNKYLIKPEQTVCTIAKGVVSAINILHQNGFSHEELTTDNVLITNSGGVCLTSTGKAIRYGNFQEDLFRIGVLLYQLCLKENYVTELDLNEIESQSIRNIINKAIKGKYKTCSSLLEALENIDNPTSTEGRTIGFIDRYFKTKISLSSEDYGTYYNPHESFQLGLETENTSVNSVQLPDLKKDSSTVLNVEKGQIIESEERISRLRAAEEKKLAGEEAERKAEESRRKAEEERTSRLRAAEEKKLVEEEAERKAEELRRKAEEERMSRLRAAEEKKLAEEVAERNAEKSGHKAEEEKKSNHRVDKKNKSNEITLHDNKIFNKKIRKMALGVIFFILTIIILLFLLLPKKKNETISVPFDDLKKEKRVDSEHDTIIISNDINHVENTKNSMHSNPVHQDKPSGYKPKINKVEKSKKKFDSNTIQTKEKSDKKLEEKEIDNSNKSVEEYKVIG